MNQVRATYAHGAALHGRDHEGALDPQILSAFALQPLGASRGAAPHLGDALRRTVAMVLAGGRGERLSLLTRDRAKPALPFGGG